MTARRPLPTVLLAVLAVLAGCDRSQRDMLRQPRWNPGDGSSLFEDGRATRAPPPHSVPQSSGEEASTSGARLGSAALLRNEAEQARQSLPRTPPRAMLVRGQQRYDIYCLPCHSLTGDGDGPVVERGFPAPPSLHADALRNASDRHLYDVISKGWGLMYPLADRIAPADRWAIVGYVRALQLSRHARIDALPPELRAALAKTPPPAPEPGEWRPVQPGMTP